MNTPQMTFPITCGNISGKGRDTIRVEEEVHHFIDLGETRSAEGEGMGVGTVPYPAALRCLILALQL